MESENLNFEEEAVFAKLVNISEDIIAHSKSGREYKLRGHLTDAYTYIYNQCSSKPSKSENMFNKFKEILSFHFIKSANIEDGANIFKQTNKLWNGYIKFATILAKHVFSYLDRYFLPSTDNGNLIDAAVRIFDKHLFGSVIKKKIYLDSFVKAIGVMRKNMVITENYLHQFIKILYPINTELYFQIKKAYIEETRLFYNTKFSQIKYLEPLYFYSRINNLIYFEEAISTFCLYWTLEEVANERTILPIIFTKEIIEPYTDILLAHPKGFLWGLKEFKIQLLNLVTDIYSKFEGFDKIKTCYYDYVIEQSRTLIIALELINDESKIINFISEFFNKHQIILTAGFKRHQEIHVTLSNALEFGIGKWEKLPDILFRYCKKVVAEGTFDQNILIVKAVFEKMSSKDEFIHKCQAWIQSTILSDKQQLIEQHKFVSTIHELCGSQNTLKLNKLLSDYIEQNQDRNNTSSLFKCKVISHHLWERRFKQEIAICLTLPQALESVWNDYLNIYFLSHSKKALRLLPLSSTILMELKFNCNRKLTIRCNLLQASILLSLDQKPKTEEELIAHINTEKHLIISYVATAKFLTSDGEKLAIDWNNQQQGFRDYTEQFQEKSKFIKAIEQDRNILLQAGIVRMIKRRKEATFQEIYDYLCKNIKLFRPQPHMVKVTIQKLIKRDFIDSNEQGLYVYKQ